MSQELYQLLVLAYTSTDNAIRQQAEAKLISGVIENIQNFQSIAQIAKSQDSMQHQAASLLNSVVLRMLQSNIELQLEHAQLVFDVIISQQTSLKCKQLLQKSMSLLIKLNKKIKPEIENKMKQLVKSDQIWEIQSGLFFFKTLIDSLDLSQYNLILNQGLDWIKDFFDLIYPLLKQLDEQLDNLTEEYIITIRYYIQIVSEYCEKLFKQKAHNKESLIPLQNMMFKLNSFQLTLFTIFKYSPSNNVIKSCIISCTNNEQFDNKINEIKMYGLKCLQLLINLLISKSKNEQRNSVFYNQQSNLCQLLLYSIFAYTRQTKIQDILQKQFLPSILSSMLRLLAHLGGQTELYHYFQESKGLLITDIIYPFLITTKNEYQLMKEQPEEFVNIALDVVDKQESDLPKTAATTLLETLCDHIDGSTSYLAQMAIVVISSAILELSQSQLSKQQQQIILTDIQQISDKKLFQEFTAVDRIESSLMILAIISYLVQKRQDIIQLMEQLLQSNLLFFTNTTEQIIKVRFALFFGYYCDNLFKVESQFSLMLNYIQLLITYAKPQEPVVLYQSIDALKDIFENDELKHKTGSLVVNVFPSLINGLRFSTYERHFEMIGNLLKKFPSIFIANETYIINLIQILVQRIILEEKQIKTNNDSTRYIHLNRCWNLIRQLPSINEFSPLLLKIEQAMQPIYESIVIQDNPMNFDEDLILFISSVIQKIQSITQFQKDILPYFSKIITKQSGKFVYLYETLNMYMYYGRSYFLQEQAQTIYFQLCLQSLIQEEAFEDIDLAEGALLIQLGIQILQNDINQTILTQVFQQVLQLIAKENVTGIIRSRITAIFLVAFYYIPQQSYQILGELFQNVYQKVLITQYHAGYDIKLFIITICKLIQSTPQLLNAELIQIIIRNLEIQENDEKTDKTDFDDDMMDDDEEEEEILEEEERQQAKQQIELLKSDLQNIDEFTLFRNTLLSFKTQYPNIIESIKQTLDHSNQQKLNNYLKFMRIDKSENARKVMTTGKRKIRQNI
ncbi:unnamed protein product [Paramecium pentaurelia]|uniref:Uncharacterized protein n=1 Tax=Paramecium pentaurelia TaxID=43138 RepID=A0A8S1XK52_9CILI|nr:unnamed protein product [Paramecium pentaurelia]